MPVNLVPFLVVGRIGRPRVQEAIMARNTQQEQPEQEQTENGAPEVSGEQVTGVLLAQAHKLKEEKEALFKRIGDNRQFLRAMVAEGSATDDQAAEVAKLYPPKKKGEQASEEAPQEAAA